jgi:ABC-type sugar transport system permease subunit
MRRVLTPYLWVLPAVAIYVVFRLYPLLYGLYLSFFEWDGVNPMKYIALKNFQEILTQDALFWQAMRHNVVYALGTVIAKNALAIVVAVALNQKLRGIAVFRTILFTPVIMSFVVVGLLWGWVFNYQFGLLNGLLRGVGLETLVQDWIGDPNLALFSVMGVDVWKWFGFHMVIYLAALQGIPHEYYEAARIDGASTWDSFRRITLPLLMPVMLINVTLSLQGAFNVFDLVYVVTEGGPFNSTLVVAIHMYLRGFKFYRMGYASAMAYVLFAIVAVSTVIQMRFMRKDVYE